MKKYYLLLSLWTLLTSLVLWADGSSNPYFRDESRFDYPTCLQIMRDSMASLQAVNVKLIRDDTGKLKDTSFLDKSIWYEFCKSYISVLKAERELTPRQLNLEDTDYRVKGVSADEVQLQLKAANSFVKTIGLTDKDINMICLWGKKTD